MNKKLKALLLSTPAVLIIVSVLLLTFWIYSYFTQKSMLGSLILNNNPVQITLEIEKADNSIFSSNIPDGIEYSDKTINQIDFGTQWAKINVAGWSATDIPVFFGDTSEILAKGAGQWIGSYFCGLGKSCIISANVMTHFYEIEDTKIGTLISVNTIYGGYEYEVTDKFVFSAKDIDILYDEYPQDTLIMHTEYPRHRAIKSSGDRIALICTLKRGTVYQNIFQ